VVRSPPRYARTNRTISYGAEFTWKVLVVCKENDESGSLIADAGNGLAKANSARSCMQEQVEHSGCPHS
jgi:ubiquinone/menaquinone biosynthesis C-methylase UbiE